MGVIEMEFGPLIKRAVETQTIEPLLRRMALLIERQSIALSGFAVKVQYLDEVNAMGKIFFDDLKQLMAASNAPPPVEEAHKEHHLKGT